MPKYFLNILQFVIVTIVKGVNVLCKTGVQAIEAAEKKYKEMDLTEGNI
ncbi:MULTISPECIES: hypothetical protein [unclassified Clostridium]|nr:hypothetical protein [Clostridium sp. HV4-5-A1G]CAB1240379.1 hypothetical protein CLOSBL3_10185 [Clostridiaceae bacterium BL-3]